MSWSKTPMSVCRMIMEGPLAPCPSLRSRRLDHGPGARECDADSCAVCCATVRFPRARVGRQSHARWWGEVIRALRLGLLCVLVSGGCSVRQPMQSRVDPANEWQTLIRAGCFSCLRDALARLEAAAVLGNSPELARAAFSTAALLVVRARELGLPETPFMESARFWSGHIKPSARQLPPSAFFDALELIQGDTTGLPPSERERRAVQHRVRWTNDGSVPPARAALSPFVGDDVVAEVRSADP